MSNFLRGESIVLGVGVEADRGTPVDPQLWIPGRAASDINLALEKVEIREARGTKVATKGSEIVKRRAEGSLELNARVESLGFLLKGVLGSVASAQEAGETVVYRHTFSVLANSPEHPSLTLALHRPNIQGYNYPLGIPVSLTLQITPDDLVVATVQFIAANETEKEGGPFVPSFVSRDYFFRHQDAVVKLAENVAGLGAASPLKAKELEVVIGNNGRADHNVAELAAGNVLAGDIEPTGRLAVDVRDKTLHDLFSAGTSRALSIHLERDDVEIGNDSHPTLNLVFPNITFEDLDEDRPIDDVAREGIEFRAHYDATAGNAISAYLINERADYAADES